jgi:alpha-soluble NSF attachment protein
MAANASAQKSRGDLAMDAGNKALKKSGFSSFFSSKVISFNGYGDRLRSPQPAATETSAIDPLSLPPPHSQCRKNSFHGLTAAGSASASGTPRNISQEDKFEKAVEFFVKAGNAYKLAKSWPEAGEAFYAAADCYKELGNFGDTGSKLKESGECFRRQDAQRCVEVWKEAVEVYVESGKWNRSGDTMKMIAEMYEKPDAGGLMCEDPIMEALDCYQLAADYYKNESPPREVATNNMLQKVATLSAQKGELPRAAEIFDEMARGYLDSKMLKFNARGLMMKALVCWMAHGDMVSVEQKLAEFSGLDHTMGGSLEDKFINEALAALKDHNKDAFGTAAAEYNQIKKLDPWMTSLLLKAKRSIPEEEGEVEEEEEPEPQTADDDEDLT